MQDGLIDSLWTHSRMNLGKPPFGACRWGVASNTLWPHSQEQESKRLRTQTMPFDLFMPLCVALLDQARDSPEMREQQDGQ